MEEYRSLYRKYRPQSPSEVLGQEHVVRALSGAITEGRLAHAFLFSGPRGTGKTSTARILAKMVNCELGPTAEPCGKCEQCLRIRDGSHLDVIEIDAASHGGVDDARELRERAPTAPAQGREKVYIIDEAQRLTAPAFDALLKLFEEPPPGVRFVLATTEPQKMPGTIVGRCQRFEFRRVPFETVAAQLAAVSERESIELAAGAAEAIARESEGSLRDALSLLDQAAVLGGGSVTPQVVESLVGEPEVEVQFGLADAIAVGDAKGVFGIVHSLVQKGHDIRHVATRVTTHFRNLLIALSSPGDEAILDVPAELVPQLAAQAAKFSAAELDRILALLLQAQTDLRWTTSPRLTLELALVRASLPESDPQPAALVSRIERLERLAGIQAGAAPQRGEAPPAETTSLPSEAAAEAPTQEPPPPVAEARPDQPTAQGSVDAHMLRSSWPQVVEELKERRKMVLFANAQVATVGSYEDDVLELIFPPGREFGAKNVEQKQGDLRDVLREMFGIMPKLRFTVRQGAIQEADAEADLHAEPIAPEQAEELLKRQLGAEVVED